MATDTNDLFRQIEQIETLLASPEGKSKRTALKSAQRKLYSQYRKAMSA